MSLHVQPLQELEINHPDAVCLVDPDTAFWALVKRRKLKETKSNGKLLKTYLKKSREFADEMRKFRFSQKPSAVYFNPTELCNLNCSYCYIPANMRRNGSGMSEENLFKALRILRSYFSRSLPKDSLPQIVFHGAEPLLNRQAMFKGIDAFLKDFRFGVQTNATFLDNDAVKFLISRKVSIGVSLDSSRPEVADRTRKNWSGEGVFQKVMEAMDRLKGYSRWSVICTITGRNADSLPDLVKLLHEHEAPACMLNIVRCTLPPAREVKPRDGDASRHFIRALDRSHELYKKTGRKIVIANFANTLLSIIAPTARRLMCDISPCGGGRCFIALAPNGDVYPCSEFIGLPRFTGGNLFKDWVEKILTSQSFRMVTQRKVEDIESCRDCEVRHFCGSPCPAEAYEMNGGMSSRGAFCDFYKEQVFHAFRVIADGKQDDYLWDNWKKDMKSTFEFGLS